MRKMRYDYDSPTIVEKLLDEQSKQRMIPMSVLEDIKAEIENEILSMNENEQEFNDGLRYVLDIINKHIGKENKHDKRRSIGNIERT